MSVNVAQSASLTINGLTPVAGAGFTLLASPALSATNVQYGDYFAETFTINPSTPTTVQPIGNIATGSVLWVQTDQPITVTLTQTSGSNSYDVDSFLYVNATFTAVSFANAGTAAAHINLVAVGARAVNPGTAGIF